MGYISFVIVLLFSSSISIPAGRGPKQYRVTLDHLVKLLHQSLPFTKSIVIALANELAVLKAVIDDQDVQCYWHMLALYIIKDEDVAELLHAIVDLWITTRGFALTSSWLEQYKLANKKNVKKSKSLRTGLQDGPSK